MLCVGVASSESVSRGAHEDEELHFFGQHADALGVDGIQPLGFLGQQCTRDTHVVARFGQVAGHRDQARRDRIDRSPHLRRDAFAQRDGVAVELDAAFDAAHQRDDVVRQVGAVAEHRALVGVAGGLAGWQAVGHVQQFGQAARGC